ncbi:hypothetical protein [Cellulophaga sp. BC115SP]|uniref:hypothetical protein n=1 Tax=Cellulophaga sp. BC115SP TaxID=2683263 RepID=UPI0014124D5C|nr:hypothetical protein [Cellulophaga sp. BC115SP]NBB28291.1 hypothetical protein [Cellulophaga sp. BC115SP]
MKVKLLFSSLFVTLLLSLVSCDKKEDNVQPSSPTKIIRANSSRIGDGDVMLSEVTVYGISMRGNNFDMILSWYNNSTHVEERQTVTFSPYAGISMDDEVLNSEEFKAKVIAYINNMLSKFKMKLNDAEINILKTLTYRQIVQYGFIYYNAKTYGENLIKPGSLFAGWSIDEGINNAFVHTQIAYNLKVAFGYTTANNMLIAHESGQGNALNSIMDVRNNNIGLSLDYWTEDLLKNLGVQGSLWSIVKINGVPTLGQFKLILPSKSNGNQP